MPVSSKDYIIYKLRTLDPESHGVKIDFYTNVTDASKSPSHLGYANLLPMHLAESTGSVTLAINDSRGLPIGQVAGRYLVCKPSKGQLCDMSRSYTKWWKRSRPALEVGHRGLGSTHSSEINSANEEHKNVKHENTIASLITAAESGADYVEFDVQLSRDKVPIIWHDFNVSILLRKKKKDQHRVHHIPVHELSYSQLKDLRVDFAKSTASDHVDLTHSVDDPTPNALLLPFPTLKEALEAVDEAVGFYVELKYPQHLHASKGREEGLELYFERNEFLDPILKELYKYAKNRRIVLGSFDPDICILARLKQNRYPVIFLVEDLGDNTTPYLHDIRTHKVTTAISVASSEKFLGLSVNDAALLRKQENLLESILRESLICFVWGSNVNNAEVRKDLKARGAHAICYDEIQTKESPNIYRAEHEEKLRKMLQNLNLTPGVSPSLSACSSRDSSMMGSAPNLLDVITELENQAKTGSTSSAVQLANLQQAYSSYSTNSNKSTTDLFSSGSGAAALPQASNSTPQIEVNGVNVSSCSINKAVMANLSSGADLSSPPSQVKHSGQDADYATDFY